MSTGLAYELPARSPREVDPRPSHIEIVSTRHQRRARPKVVYAVVAVGGLFVILMAQLLLSIVLSDGAYQISDLQSAQKELDRDQQALTESLQVLESPQNLANRAQALGMVVNSGSAGWLRLSDGAVLHAPSAASSTSAVTGDSIANELITEDVSGLGTQAPTTPPTDGGTAGAPTGTTPPPSVPSNAGLPAPNTH